MTNVRAIVRSILTIRITIVLLWRFLNDIYEPLCYAQCDTAKNLT